MHTVNAQVEDHLMPVPVEGLRPLVAGNWKMNGLRSALSQVETLKTRLADPAFRIKADVMICPPVTLLGPLATVAKGSGLQIGAQDCHPNVSGAHTGDVSAEMLQDAGATAVIVGHSERRTDHRETDATVRAKCLAAHRAGLVAIVCVGETADERQAGQTLAVVTKQIAGSLPDSAPAATTIIAYEPVWAIGTGLTPTAADVAEVHATLRGLLQTRFGDEGGRMRLLYGGSVKPSNAHELMHVENVDGALVGGASLKAEDFIGILRAYA